MLSNKPWGEDVFDEEEQSPTEDFTENTIPEFPEGEGE